MKLRIALAVAALAAAVGSAATAAPATTTASASATIVAPGQLSATRNLEFGTIARPSTTNTTVTVPSGLPDVTPTVSGGDGFAPVSNQAHAATFRLIGSPGQQYTVGANTLSFTNATGNLTSVGSESPTAQAGTTLNTLPADTGIQDLYVGGHFTISPTTATQTYPGTLSLTINFN